MKTLNSFLELIHDPRRAQGQRFCLSSFFEMVFLAGMSGRFSINAIARFIEYNQEFFIDRYGLLHGVPKKTVIFNILRDFDYTELNKALVSWMSQYMGNTTKPIGCLLITHFHGNFKYVKNQELLAPSKRRLQLLSHGNLRLL